MLQICTMYFKKNENVGQNLHKILHHSSLTSFNSLRGQPQMCICLQCRRMLTVYSRVQISPTMSWILKNSTMTSLSLTLFKNNYCRSLTVCHKTLQLSTRASCQSQQSCFTALLLRAPILQSTFSVIPFHLFIQRKPSFSWFFCLRYSEDLPARNPLAIILWQRLFEHLFPNTGPL